MHTYTIKLNDYPIGQVKGKHKAFEFIQAKLKQEGTLGIWRGMECITDNDTYKIERANNE